jgi:hypothetical protein
MLAVRRSVRWTPTLPGKIPVNTIMGRNFKHLTHAISNRALRASHASGTPTATVTWFSMRLTRLVLLVRGGPASLLLKASEFQSDTIGSFLTSSGGPTLTDKVLSD